MALQTVQTCIDGLNKEDFYSKKVRNSVFRNFNLAMCYLSIVKYENTFYRAQGDDTKNCCNLIDSELVDKIKHIVLKNEDNIKLDCWDINPNLSDKYVVIFGGIGSEKSNNNLQNTYLKFVKKGWGVIAFDYRGRGGSTGIFCQKNALKDAKVVWEYLLRKGINSYNIGVLGHSMGAAVALDFASRYNTSFVLLLNPFNKAVDMVKNIARQLSLPSFIKKTVKKLPDFLIPLRNRFNNENALNKVHSPTLIIHTKDDDTIPVELCRKLYDKNNTKNNITYLELEGTDHEINDDKIDICLHFIEESHLWFFNS